MPFTYINTSGFSGFYKESPTHKNLITNFIKSHCVDLPKDLENQCLKENNCFIGEGLNEIKTAPCDGDGGDRYRRATNVCDLYFHKYIDLWKTNEIDIRVAAVKMLITMRVLNYLLEIETNEEDKFALSQLKHCYKEHWMMRRRLIDIIKVNS